MRPLVLGVLLAGLLWLVVGGGAGPEVAPEIGRSGEDLAASTEAVQPIVVVSGGVVAAEDGPAGVRAAVGGISVIDGPRPAGVLERAALGVGVAGRAVDLSGSPLAGLHAVALVREAPEDAPKIWTGSTSPWAAFADRTLAEAVTDGQGYFVIEVPPEPDKNRDEEADEPPVTDWKELTYTLSGETRSTRRMAVTNLVPGETREVGDVLVPRAARIEGLVVSLGGRPVAGARIVRREPGARPSRWVRNDGPAQIVEVAVADESGRFEADDVEPGECLLVARLPNHLPGNPLELDLIAGEAMRGLVLELDPGGAVEGRTLDAAGDPAPGVSVFARVRRGRGSPEWRESTAVIRGALSDAEGRFRIEGLEPVKGLVVQAEIGEVEVMEFVVPPASGVVLRPPGLTLLTGRVVDPDGAVIGSGRIETEGSAPSLNPDRPWPRTWSESKEIGDEGRFEFTSLKPGAYTLTIRPQGWPEKVVKGLQLSASGGTHDMGDIAMPAGGRLVVTVTRSDRTPLADVQVSAWPAEESVSGGIIGREFTSHNRQVSWSNTSSSGQPAESESDAAGQAVLQGLASGAWALRASLDGYSLAEPVTVRVGSAGDEKQVDLVMAAAGRIEGIVLWPDGSPAVGLHVRGRRVDEDPAPERLAEVDPGATAYMGRGETGDVDGQGRWALEETGAGQWDLWVLPPTPGGLSGWSARNYVSRQATGKPQATLVLAEGEVATVSLTPPDWGAFEGTVRRRGLPVRGAKVSARPAGERRSAAAVVETDGSGRYRLAGLQPGGWTVSAYEEGNGLPTEVEHRVTRGPNRLDFDLAIGSIEGRVTAKGTGRPLSGVTVRVRVQSSGRDRGRGGRNVQVQTQTDLGGRFALEGIPGGAYVVFVNAEDYVDQDARVELPMDAVRTGFDFALAQGGRIDVRMGALAPITGQQAWLEARSEGGGSSQWKAGAPLVQFKGLPPGSWTVSVFGMEGDPFSAPPVEVREGRTAEVDL